MKTNGEFIELSVMEIEELRLQAEYRRIDEREREGRRLFEETFAKATEQNTPYYHRFPSIADAFSLICVQR